MKRTLISLLFLISLSGCGLESKTLGSEKLETKSLEDFYEGDIHEVSKVIIVDGNTGESVTSTDREQIRLFIDDINDVKFILEEDQSKRDGFYYSITFYQDKEETFQFGVSEIDGNYYHTDPDLNLIVDEFYSTLKTEGD